MCTDEKNTNTGDWNTGDWNTGDWNTGDWNTGDCNTGDRNTGNRNTGDRNTGDCNTGDWNTGDRNTGYLNTDTPKIRIFNKDTDIEYGDFIFPNYFFEVYILEWVNKEDMTKQEKEDYPTYKTTGGFLKQYTYHEAWRNAWNDASDEDRRKTLELPNWDNEIFKEITGIDVEKELSQPCHCRHYDCDCRENKYCPYCGGKL